MLTKLGYKETEVKKMMWDVLTKGRHANIVAEGDDGLHAFVAKFVELFGGVHQFGKMWCACYAEYGFQIEPQSNEDEVKPEDCLTPTCERVEFCSKIQVAVGEYTYGFPKPSKVANSLSTSFNTEVPRHDACATKAVALMSSCLRQPLLFELCAIGASQRGGTRSWRYLGFNGHVEDAMLKMGDKYSEKSGHSFYAKLLTDHWNFVCDGDAALAMMKALERETGIDVQAQEDLMVCLRRGSRDAITVVLKALRCWVNVARDLR